MSWSLGSLALAFPLLDGDALFWVLSTPDAGFLRSPTRLIDNAEKERKSSLCIGWAGDVGRHGKEVSGSEKVVVKSQK
jgi:hypothetical protein